MIKILHVVVLLDRTPRYYLKLNLEKLLSKRTSFYSHFFKDLCFFKENFSSVKKVSVMTILKNLWLKIICRTDIHPNEWIRINNSSKIIFHPSKWCVIRQNLLIEGVSSTYTFWLKLLYDIWPYLSTSQTFIDELLVELMHLPVGWPCHVVRYSLFVQSSSETQWAEI